MVRAEEARTARGAWGAYRGAPLPHLAMAEGGQSSTGSALQWMGRLFGGAPAFGSLVRRPPASLQPLAPTTSSNH